MREDSAPMLLVKNQDQLTKKSKATDELIESLIFAIPEASQPEKGRMYNMAWKMVSAEGAYKDEQRHLLQARLNAAKLKDDRPTLSQKMLEDFEADLKKDNAASPGYEKIQVQRVVGEDHSSWDGYIGVPLKDYMTSQTIGGKEREEEVIILPSSK